ncbi:MAG: DUF805 domain-containing protein [Thermoguttaceae bacterium]|nr:DUF805 domain-containing protein [Thermoguttaceae bacterium]
MFFAFACWIGLAVGLGAILAHSINGEEIVERLALFFYWTSDLTEPALVPGAILGAFVFVPPILSLFARRLHDVGLSGWYVVVLFSSQSICKSLNLDLFASFVPLFLLFWPGTKGENAYGPDPRRATTSDRKDS